MEWSQQIIQYIKVNDNVENKEKQLWLWNGNTKYLCYATKYMFGESTYLYLA